MTDKPMLNGLTEAETLATPSVAGLSAVPELLVVGYLDQTTSAFSFYRFEPAIPLTPQAPAQATIAALSAEIERLKREKSELSYELGAAMQRCSLTIDRLTRERDALKAKQVADVEAVMRLADALSMANRMYNQGRGTLGEALDAREALRSHLTKDRP